MKKLILVFLIFGASSFATTFGLNCSYNSYSDGVAIKKPSSLFKLDFIVDTEANKCYLSGNVGTAEVICTPNDEGLISFIEITNSGNVNTTTIDKNLKSVHSRNVVLFGELTPSQYYGTCAKK